MKFLLKDVFHQISENMVLLFAFLFVLLSCALLPNHFVYLTHMSNVQLNDFLKIISRRIRCFYFFKNKLSFWFILMHYFKSKYLPTDKKNKTKQTNKKKTPVK